MAATLTETGGMTYVSFPISGVEKNEDGDLIVLGKATDGSVDSDGQIVDPGWSAKALQEWLDSAGNVRVQHQAQRDPAGKGLELSFSSDGHYVKSLIVEPVAKRLVEKGVLTAYSVGISRPVIEPDMTGKARGGVIKGGVLVELSLVDRPANKNCGIQLVKSEYGGVPEWVGKVWGDDLLTKATMPTPATDMADMDDIPGYETDQEPGTEPTDPSVTPQDKSVKYKSVSLELPEDVNVGFSPADLAKLQTFAQELGAELAEFQKAGDAEEHFLGKKHRKFSASRRRSLSQSGHALPDGSYPVPDKDALRRAAILARSGHGNVAAARRLIARRARELGVENPLNESDSVKKDEGLEAVAEKTVTCTACKDKGCAKCSGMKAEAEPDAEKGLNQMDADDHDTDSDSDEDDKPDKAAAEPEAEKAKKPKGKNPPPWLKDGKGGDDDSEDSSDDSNKSSTPTAGVVGMHSEPVPAHREPDGNFIEALESDAGMPTVPDGSVKADGGLPAEEQAALRLKSLGIAHQLGVLHDLTCPAFSPEDVAKAHPGSSLANIDVRYFAEKAMSDAAGAPMELAAKSTQLWTHAQTLKSLTIDDVTELQAEAHKAFRDANPGPSSFPTPCEISPGKYNRGAITAGHAAYSPGSTEAASSAARVPSGQTSASQYGRGFISDGHAADSPANKGTGVPERVNYVPTIRDNARQAMRAMHDHVAQTFPDVCPLGPDHVQSIASRPVPTPQGTPSVSALKAEDPQPEAAVKGLAEPDLTAFSEADVEKAQKKLRKKLGKRVLSGKMTVDEARAKIGRAVAQKGGGQSGLSVTNAGAPGWKSESAPESAPVPEAPVQKAAQVYDNGGYLEPAVTSVTNTTDSAIPVSVNGAASPDLVKAAMAEMLAPLLEKIAAQNDQLTEQRKLLDSLTDQPDPNVAAFRGIAANPMKMASARPAGVQSVAEIAERTQAMMLRELEAQWRNSSDPAQREAAWRSIVKMRGINP